MFVRPKVIPFPYLLASWPRYSSLTPFTMLISLLTHVNIFINVAWILPDFTSNSCLVKFGYLHIYTVHAWTLFVDSLVVLVCSDLAVFILWAKLLWSSVLAKGWVTIAICSSQSRRPSMLLFVRSLYIWCRCCSCVFIAPRSLRFIANSSSRIALSVRVVYSGSVWLVE